MRNSTDLERAIYRTDIPPYQNDEEISQRRIDLAWDVSEHITKTYKVFCYPVNPVPNAIKNSIHHDYNHASGIGDMVRIREQGAEYPSCLRIEYHHRVPVSLSMFTMSDDLGTYTKYNEGENLMPPNGNDNIVPVTLAVHKYVHRQILDIQFGQWDIEKNQMPGLMLAPNMMTISDLRLRFGRKFARHFSLVKNLMQHRDAVLDFYSKLPRALKEVNGYILDCKSITRKPAAPKVDTKITLSDKQLRNFNFMIAHKINEARGI